MSGLAYKKGFTLIELLVTLAVLAIVMAFAVPSFQQLIANNRLSTEVNTLVSALQLARSEAVKRGTEVSVAATNGTSLVAGYCVTLGGADDPCTDDDDNQIRVFGAVESSVNTNPAVTEVVFNRMGELVNGVAITVSVTPPSCPPGKVDALRQIRVGAGGQVTLTRGNCP